MIGFKYDTYQDVRHNLFLYTLPTAIAAAFFLYFVVLPDPHAALIAKVASTLSTHPVWKSVTLAALVTAFVALLVEVLKIHDHYYDRWVVQWRRQYDPDFIMTRLVHPFASHLPLRFHVESERNTRQFMERLYYPYVGDRDLKIGKNKLVRFYERVTIYWLTQMNEIFILVIVLTIAGYRVLGPGELAFRARLLDALLWMIFAFIVNRAWIRAARNGVREPTFDEIQEIHDGHAEDLEVRIKKVCADFSLPYSVR